MSRLEYVNGFKFLLGPTFVYCNSNSVLIKLEIVLFWSE
ncbi:unnamed protein product [Brugia timori]|uniref:Uncharacterized protein n=1 Tax=Brugia timori TaxID=42155 RepID=A0A0R3Q7X7_9BILA|nr:unnamed protein product [Brugia timori]